MDPEELLEQPKDIELEKFKKSEENFEKLQDKRVSLHDIDESGKVNFPEKKNQILCKR